MSLRRAHLLAGLAVITTLAAGAVSGALQPSSEQAGADASGRTPQDPFQALDSQPEIPETAAGDAVYLAATSCGTERWSIKTGQDSAARSIDVSSPRSVTVAALRSYAKPSSYPATTRIGTVEKTGFRVDATLVKYKVETDSDLHLVLQDSSGRQVVVEIPDPSCMGGSVWKSRVTTVRSTFLSRYRPTGSFKTTSKHVVVQGVGFFDRLHGQTGMAPNGLELHAVTALTF